MSLGTTEKEKSSQWGEVLLVYVGRGIACVYGERYCLSIWGEVLLVHVSLHGYKRDPCVGLQRIAYQAMSHQLHSEDLEFYSLLDTMPDHLCLSPWIHVVEEEPAHTIHLVISVSKQSGRPPKEQT